MARLQIVTLPTVKVGDVSAPEYLIVIDEVDGEFARAIRELSDRANFRESTGARGILVFENTIEVV